MFAFLWVMRRYFRQASSLGPWHSLTIMAMIVADELEADSSKVIIRSSGR